MSSSYSSYLVFNSLPTLSMTTLPYLLIVVFTPLWIDTGRSTGSASAS